MEKEHQEIPIGFKNGCFSVISGLETFKKEIENAEQMRQKYLNSEIKKDKVYEELLIDSIIIGVNKSSFCRSPESFLDAYIETLKSKKGYGYKIQCNKCGKVFLCSENDTWWLWKKFRYCSDGCFSDRVYDKTKNFDVDYTNTIHESLKILECIDENYEYGSWMEKTRGKRIKHIKLCKKYRCQCYLCQEEYIFESIDFEIKNDDYGRNADIGYYSDAHCDCHKISSFQWRTINILKEYNVNYKVEVSFPELIGSKNLLRYDFAIFDTNGNIKFLIECQGKQHYEPVKEFGGKSQFKYQVENDKLKRDYAKKSNIPLVEIPYTCDTYEKELEFLKKQKVI